MEQKPKQFLLLQERILNNLSDEPYFKGKDHSVSQQEFEIRYNEEFDMMVTFPAPEVSELPDFYKGEDYISHTDSRKTIFDKVYQLVKTYMLDRKLKWIKSGRKQPGTLLDIGAGTGDFLLRAKAKAWKTSGVEPSDEARKLALKKGVALEKKTSNLPDGRFDVITMWHVLEHVPDLEKQFRELQRLLKPDGLLIIAVPNFKSYDAYKYKDHWAAFDVPRHLWHFSSNSIERISREFNFEVTNVKPLKFDSYYVSLLSEKYRSGSRNIFKGFWNGLLSNMIAKKTKQHSSLVYFLQKSSQTQNKAI